MLAACTLIARWMKGVTPERFFADDQLRSAVAMQLIVIGEGARCLSDTTKAEAPEVPWRAVVNMRHRLAHGYGRASAVILMETAADWVPQLAPPLRSLLDALGPDET
jgi:uncharacterized protein with HEPN domain